MAQTLRGEGIETVLIRNGRPDQAGLPPRVVAEVAAGSPVSQRLLYEGRLMLAEGRPAGAGDGIVLLQPVITATTRTVFNRLWLALGAGLLAGVLAGFLLARRLGRPLRQVADRGSPTLRRRPGSAGADRRTDRGGRGIGGAQ